MAPRPILPLYMPCITSRNVNMMDFTPMNGLCDIAQLTLRKGDYLGEPGLIR